MPDDSEVPQSRTADAMGERVMRVETKIEGIEKDTAHIRSTLHDINGEMQKFVFEESGCRRALETIVEQTKHLPVMAANFQIFNEMKPTLTLMLDERQQQKGSWSATVRIATMVVSTITMLSILATGIIWLFSHVSLVNP